MQFKSSCRKKKKRIRDIRERLPYQKENTFLLQEKALDQQFASQILQKRNTNPRAFKFLRNKDTRAAGYFEEKKKYRINTCAIPRFFRKQSKGSSSFENPFRFTTKLCKMTVPNCFKLSRSAFLAAVDCL